MKHEACNVKRKSPIEGLSLIRASCFLLQILDVVDYLVHRASFRLSALFPKTSPFSLAAALRLFNLKVHPGVILNANDSQKRTDCGGCAPLSADYLAHVLRIDFKGQKHSHLIDLPF